jgi:uncharacterized membrane protein
MELTLPYLHPAIVHFPIALIMAGAVAALGYAVVGRTAWRWAALLLIGAGALGAFVAHETGEELEDAVEGEARVEALVEQHEDAAAWAQWLAVATTVVLAAIAFVSRRRTVPDMLAVRLVVLAMAVAAAAAVGWTGHLGGLMVWGVPV